MRREQEPNFAPQLDRYWKSAGQLSEKVKHHVYVRRQTRICTTWPSFPFTCPLLFIISAHKLVVSRNFLSIRIVLSSFYLLICYFEKFSTWIWRLPFAVCDVKLPNFTRLRYGVGKHNTKIFFFLFLNFNTVLSDSAPENFANIWQTKWN